MFLIIFTISMVTASITMYGGVAAATPGSTKLSVDPPVVSDIPVGDSFSVNVTVIDVEDLFQFQVALTWDPAVLTATNFEVYPPFTYSWPSAIGPYYVAVSYSMVGGTPLGGGFHGSQPIFRVDFKVKAMGASLLHLEQTKLVNPGGATLPHELVDGEFTNVTFKFSMYPAQSTAAVGRKFNITISIEEVDDMWGYEFNFTYDPQVLTAVNVTSLDPFITSLVSEPINDTAGYVFMNYSIVNQLGFSAGADAEPIAKIEFEVDKIGRCPLKLKDIKIRNTQGDVFPGRSISGSFSNFHDVAVADLSVSIKQVLIGTPVTFSVIVENRGEFPEMFNVTIRYTTLTIATFTNVSLDIGATKNLTYTWDTSDSLPGRYTVIAESVLDGDVDPLNNRSTETVILAESQAGRAMLLYGLAIGTGVFTGLSAGIYSLRARRTRYKARF